MTARQFANRTRSALEWLQGHADILPEPTSLTVWGVSKPELVWHDDESYAYWVARLDRHFGPGSTVLGREYERTCWPAEGDRPTLTVQRTRAWADFPHRTRTSVASWMNGETA